MCTVLSEHYRRRLSYRRLFQESCERTVRRSKERKMRSGSEQGLCMGKNAGCKTVLIGNQDYQQDYTVSSLKEFVDRVL